MEEAARLRLLGDVGRVEGGELAGGFLFEELRERLRAFELARGGERGEHLGECVEGAEVGAAIPTMLVFRRGKVVNALVGAGPKTKEKLEEALQAESSLVYSKGVL